MTSLEMSILFPVILLVILLMFQISLYWHTANAVGVAAEQGVNAGQVFPDDFAVARTEATTAASAILQQSVNLPENPVIVPVELNGGTVFQVTVTAKAPRLVAIGSWEVTSVAQARYEDFIPADER